MNSKCINDVLLYLDKNMIRKSSGKYIGIYARDIAEKLSEQYDTYEVFDTVQYLLENKIITQTNPDNIKSIRATKINGFTSKGKELVDTLKNPHFSDKIQNVLHKAIPLLSAGKSILECIDILL